jgi:hypothetical protein
MKTQKKNWNEPLDKKSYKKKFLVRKHEEREREQEIKDFIDEDENTVRVDGTGAVDASQR